jgi:hypothetical protein
MPNSSNDWLENRRQQMKNANTERERAKQALEKAKRLAARTEAANVKAHEMMRRARERLNANQMNGGKKK